MIGLFGNSKIHRLTRLLESFTAIGRKKKQKKNRQEGQSGSAPPARDERAEEETDDPKAICRARL